MSYGALGQLVSDGEAGAEEVVAAFQGIMCRKDLPPVVEKIRYQTVTHREPLLT